MPSDSPESDPLEQWLEILFDKGSFVALDTQRGRSAPPSKFPVERGPGLTGWGQVFGRSVFVFVHDAAVPSGVMASKVCKTIDLALLSGSPVVGIYRSAGVGAEDGLDALAGFGSIFDSCIASSGVIPQLALVVGPCLGIAAFGPALADLLIAADKSSVMFMTSSESIASVTGQQITPQELGGGSVHAHRTGVADVLAVDDHDGLRRARYLLSFLPSNNMETAPYYVAEDDPNRSCDALLDLLPASANIPYDMRLVIQELVDDGEFFELQEHWATSILTGFVRLNGHSVGVVANQPLELAGTLDIVSSVKGARFVRLCDAFNIPLLAVVDVPGFLPGVSQEFGGIIRFGAQLLYAFTEATVPRITLITRKAYGGAYLVMNSKHIRSDLTFSWPTGEIAVMGAQGAARIIHRKEIAAADDPTERETQLIGDYAKRFSNPYIAAERGYVDEVIEPKDTRRRLIRGFDLLNSKREVMPERKHGNIPL